MLLQIIRQNGETILRTGKVVKNKKDEHGMWNYSKLCFNTKYPWESAVASDIEAQQYVLYDGVSDEIKKGNVTYWHGLKNDVLYRRQFFNYDLENECHWFRQLIWLFYSALWCYPCRQASSV